MAMDASVIQAGRLAEKAKALSKEEALAAVRYGADKVFRSSNEEITDEDIDVILSQTKNLTAEREEKLKDKDKRDLLDFSNAEVNFQQFEGVDYKGFGGSGKEGDMHFMELMQDSMGKRDRGGTSHAHRESNPQSPCLPRLLPADQEITSSRLAAGTTSATSTASPPRRAPSTSRCPRPRRSPT